MNSSQSITLEELGRELASRPLCYVTVTSAAVTSPVVASMRVQSFVLDAHFPAVLVLFGKDSTVHISQIQSITRQKEGCLLVCGHNMDLRMNVMIKFGHAPPGVS